MKIGYCKIGRSLPLSLESCGMSGGDIEGIAVLMDLALRRPQDTFYILGRNSGENPQEVGFPANVVNPWTVWRPELRTWINSQGYNHSDLSIKEQLAFAVYYREKYGPLFCSMDAQVVWVGQHGSSNSPMPTTADPSKTTKPQDWENLYVSPITHPLNEWRNIDPIKREEIFLNSDPRNTLKMRDLRWPWRHQVLTQYNYVKTCQHERGASDMEQELVPPWNEYARKMENPNLWMSDVRYIYSRLEINAMSPMNPFGKMITYDETWEERRHFGLFINEARPLKAGPEFTRGPILNRWVIPLNPAFVHGKWKQETQRALGIEITLAPWEEYFPLLQSVRSTFTTPSSGSGWATAKPWEAFAAGTVVFFHPNSDDQNNVLHDAPSELRKYLRVKNPKQFFARVKEMNEDKEKWLHMVRLQKAHFDKCIQEMTYLKMIEDRLDGGE